MKLAKHLAALLLGATFSCSGEEPDQQVRRSRGINQSDQQAVSVRAFRAERRPISTYVLANTTLESIRKVTIYAKVNALVEEILVEEGAPVEVHQLLARLDDREIRNEFEQAEIALDQSRTALQQAEVREEISTANFNRSRSLFEQKLISQQDFDQAELNSRTDVLGLKVAGQQAAAAEARVEAAQIQLDNTEIRSSIRGTVTERLIEVGSRVNPNDAVFTVEDFEPLWARIYVPERELQQLRLGQVAELRLQAYPERKFQSRIKMINPTVDAESGTVKVTLEIRGGASLLRPGMFGSAFIATETHSDAIVIPKQAVLRERDENRVFVVGTEGAVEKRDVTLGFAEEDRVEVLAGVEENEPVVTVGQEGLSEGYQVAVLAWDNQLPQPSLEEAAAPESDARREQAAAPRTRTGEAEGARPGQGRQMGRGAGRRDGRDFQAFLQRALRNPQVKQAYEAKLSDDPNFMDNPSKRRAFLMEVREQLGRNRQ